MLLQPVYNQACAYSSYTTLVENTKALLILEQSKRSVERKKESLGGQLHDNTVKFSSDGNME